MNSKINSGSSLKSHRPLHLLLAKTHPMKKLNLKRLQVFALEVTSIKSAFTKTLSLKMF